MQTLNSPLLLEFVNSVECDKGESLDLDYWAHSLKSSFDDLSQKAPHLSQKAHHLSSGAY